MNNFLRVGECKKCGKCCSFMQLSIPKTEKNFDMIKYMTERYGVIGAGVRKVEEQEYIFIHYDLPCKHLKITKLEDEEEIARCLNYENRPDICKEYPLYPNENCKGYKWIEIAKNLILEKKEVIKDG